MPFLPSIAAPILLTNLISVGDVGQGAGTLAMGIAVGVSEWLPTVQVTTADTGTIGAGIGEIPLLVPTPLLLPNMTVGFAAQEIIGVMAPPTILGITNGLVLAFASALVSTTHPSVGTGSAVVKFSSPPSAQAMIAGFASQGMNTPVAAKLATAISQALDTTFAALILVSPIVGPAGPTASVGVGSGNIV